MKCPKCQEENDSTAYYCHACGNRLRKKRNGWIFFSVFLLVVVVVLDVIIVDYANSTSSLRDANYNLQYRISDMDSKLDRLESSDKKYKESQSRINTLTYQIKEKENYICNLENQLPQTYYTMYNDQEIYYWKGGYMNTGYKHSYAGTKIVIYMQKDGYGLTEWGWIPMNRLKR